MPISKKLLNQTTAERVKDHLREQIITGALKGGDRLLQDELAEQLGVSRIPLREGLAHLEAEGFILAEAHHGAVVSTLNLADCRELFELRALLECRLLASAIPAMTPDDLAQAEAVIDAMEGAGSPGPGLIGWSDRNWAFHAALYAPARQPRTLAIVQLLHRHAARYIYMQMTISGRTSRADTQHRALLDLCRTGQPEKAVAMLRDHIMNIVPDLERLSLAAHAPADTAPAARRRPSRALQQGHAEVGRQSHP